MSHPFPDVSDFSHVQGLLFQAHPPQPPPPPPTPLCRYHTHPSPAGSLFMHSAFFFLLSCTRPVSLPHNSQTDAKAQSLKPKRRPLKKKKKNLTNGEQGRGDKKITTTKLIDEPDKLKSLCPFFFFLLFLFSPQNKR